jgi:DNA replication protein DnaC
MQDAEARESAAKWLMQSLGPRYRFCTLDNFRCNVEHPTDRKKRAVDREQREEVLAAVRTFAADLPDHVQRGEGLLMYGRHGTGKDHLLTALAYTAILEHGWRVRWIDGGVLAQKARDLIGSPHDTEDELIRDFSSPRILYVSDLVPDKGEVKEYVTGVIKRIVDRRYRDLLPTWASLNVRDGPDAERRLSSPIVDRLGERAVKLACNWTSFRAR